MLPVSQHKQRSLSTSCIALCYPQYTIAPQESARKSKTSLRFPKPGKTEEQNLPGFWLNTAFARQHQAVGRNSSPSAIHCIRWLLLMRMRVCSGSGDELEGAPPSPRLSCSCHPLRAAPLPGPPAPLHPSCSSRHICAGTSDGLLSWILKSPHALNCLLKVLKRWRGHSGESGGSWAATDAVRTRRKRTCGV